MSDILRPVPLRRLSASEAPYPGDLLPGDPPLVWSDAELWRSNPGWRADPRGHVLCPVDGGRDREGARVLLPHCPHRLRDVLQGRTHLLDGEVVTIAVSLLRGASEADRLQAERGTWWLTADGRPVLATIGTSPWREETADLIARLAEGRSVDLASALAETSDLLADARRLGREGGRVEEMLFAAAAARPVAVENLAVRARTVAVARHVTQPASSGAPAAESLPSSILRNSIDGALFERIRGALERVRLGRVRWRPQSDPDAQHRPPRARRRPVMVGVGIAAVVIAVGAMWPAEDRTEASTHPDPLDPAVSSAPAATPVPSPSTAMTERPEDLGSVAVALMNAYARCAADGCSADVVEETGREFPTGATTDIETARDVTVIDEYGGVAVLRVGGDVGQIAVIVRAGETWLVRDIYDVADQQ